MINLHSVLLVIVISLVTIALRFIPFVLLGKKETPKYIQYLGNVLPYAIIGMLVVYCFKDVSTAENYFAIPEAVAVLVIIVSHKIKRSTIVSFLSGTIAYMILNNLL